jgi:acyl-coenzyme A thioesterase PaaI-like protein
MSCSTDSLTALPSCTSSSELILDPKLYRRIDEEILSAHQSLGETNAIHGALHQPRLIPKYEVYEKLVPLETLSPEEQVLPEIVVLVEVGDRLCGHPGYLHGGIIATIIDNAFGWLFTISKVKSAFTANLNVNYRKPVPINSQGFVKVQLTKREGRKLFMSATWEWKNEIFVEASTLFIIPRIAEVKEEATKAVLEDNVVTN